MNSSSCYRINRLIAPQDIEDRLPGKLSLSLIERKNQRLTLLDDFHWDIWQSGQVLTRDEKIGALRLWQANDSGQEIIPATPDCRFWWQLPGGELASRLKEILSLHAFVEKATLSFQSETLAVLNTDAKTVARIELFVVTTDTGQEHCLARLEPLKGYDAVFARVKNSFEKLAAQPLDNLNLRRIILESGLKISPPVTKAHFNLVADEPAETAITRMAHEMVMVARLYEAGMLDDIDTEFVHQYRVNLRKSRSVVSLFKKTLSVERYQSLRNELKEIASRTNELRDLDVFLLDHDYYQDMLPANLRPGLKQIMTKIKRRRATVLKQVSNNLQSETYRTRVGQLLETLLREPDFASKQSRQPLKQLVCKKVLRQYQQICTDGSQINDHTEDEAVHDLRIECKKLRYLLELFSELFPKGQVKQLVKQLKKLQDNLGRFNDFSVQQDFLLEFGRGRAISDQQSACINGLVAVLFNKQQHERNLVVDNVSVFVDRPVREMFQQLFASPETEKP